MDRVSVIIPTYNHAQYIGPAIESVLNSSHSNVEIVVIDDGSRDETSEIVKGYKDVRYFYQSNRGAHEAINAGIDFSSSPYIAILNDDDLFMRNHLEIGLTNLRTFGNQLFIGSPQVFGSGAKLAALKLHLYQSRIDIETLGFASSLFRINWSTSTSSFIFSRELVTRIGMFQEFAMCHDLDFMIRALTTGKSSVGVSSTPTWKYRCHETNSGSSIGLTRQSAEITYCLGRALQALNVETSASSLTSVIGYGIEKWILDLAATYKPWVNESRIIANDSIQRWVNLIIATNDFSKENDISDK